MVRPLFPILLGFIAGILLEHYGNVSTSSWFPIPLILVYGLLWVLYLGSHVRKYDRLCSGLLLILALLIGITRYAVFNHLPDNHIAHFVEDERVTIEGYLYRPPEYSGEKRYLYVKTTSLEKGFYRYYTTGNIRITLTGASFADSGKKALSYGDIIRTRLRLYVPKNSGTFDYREFLRRRKIYLIGTLRHDRYLLQLQGQRGNRMLKWIYHLQGQILGFLDTHIPQSQETASPSDRLELSAQALQVIKAMTLGQTRALTTPVREKFRNAGMYHFLVVSGIHIGILTWVCHRILNFCSIPLHYRGGILIVMLVFYAGLTGFHFPVLRAVIMVMSIYLSITCNRIPDPVYSLAFAIGLILFVFPSSLFEVSFQMTVAATASILLFFRVLRHQMWFEGLVQSPWFVRVPAMAFLATCGAMVGISPLTIYYFGSFYPASFLSTPLALPVVSLLLPSGLFSNFFSLVFHWDWLSPVFSINLFLAKCLLFLASIFPELNITLPRPSPFILMMYYIGIYCLFSFYQKATSNTARTT